MAFEWHLMAPKALEEAIRLWRRLPERAEAVACAQYLSVSVLLRMFDPKDLFHSKRNKKSSFRFLLTPEGCPCALAHFVKSVAFQWQGLVGSRVWQSRRLLHLSDRAFENPRYAFPSMGSSVCLPCTWRKWPKTDSVKQSRSIQPINVLYIH